MKKVIIFTAIIFAIVSSSGAQTIKSITVSDLEARIKLGKDTVYVVNFWATWCKPCIKELPNFEQFSARSRATPVKVLLVTVDNKSRLESGVTSFVKRNNLKNEVLHLSETNYAAKIDKKWIGSLPATLFWNAKTGRKKLVSTALTFDELTKHYKEFEN